MSESVYSSVHRPVRLYEKAHCRFGDKGDTGLFVLIPYATEDFETLVALLTPERIARHLGDLPPGWVTCRPAASLGAIVIAVDSSLSGGVTASLALDAHGKTLSGYLLGMIVPWPES